MKVPFFLVEAVLTATLMASQSIAPSWNRILVATPGELGNRLRLPNHDRGDILYCYDSYEQWKVVNMSPIRVQFTILKDREPTTESFDLEPGQNAVVHGIPTSEKLHLFLDVVHVKPDESIEADHPPLQTAHAEPNQSPEDNTAYIQHLAVTGPFH
ncbi:hypothetical protein MJO28_006025 [Puccinia striiformis f. sp. tritici]|uniref:Secreted protein n=3 Tax=Puccinia striiformis TaxID=27350 RepID=A0A0L0V2V8_9BASI|nr:hypothetical protein Pst134EA_011261 [Puccinia striiformis f. sp. tritici]KAI9604871.1 hypothetical protein H4Q26_002841 [Puccinia striiformis f. sp. tritici PST-130]KNE93324.1 hypothetical protein PSTG_13266 [Puccinia striiformis f. sp. tritici PST-78]POW21439.1 hypothetical protein PSHT_02354 [Puccinia striiformis]KAH9456016.1 hypothetical protein Pst134EB_012237 [Puccinia striiformis f. sp. tritici]KAH9467623.1 hypothetical protein Pst134EA_011261 [Puccinia striiformis f. sp. tritici]